MPSQINGRFPFVSFKQRFFKRISMESQRCLISNIVFKPVRKNQNLNFELHSCIVRVSILKRLLVELNWKVGILKLHSTYNFRILKWNNDTSVFQMMSHVFFKSASQNKRTLTFCINFSINSWKSICHCLSTM